MPFSSPLAALPAPAERRTPPLSPGHWDAIVVGGGHAGSEAAWALARLGLRALLVTNNIETIGVMSCNPAIGGMAKGHIVKEIDALGGIMGYVGDAAAIHYKHLNTRKGPAVWSSRTQSDMAVYRDTMQQLLMNTPGLDIKQASVESLIIEKGRVAGIVDNLGVPYRAPAVILTTGTFLRGRCHVGLRSFSAGRAGDTVSVGLAEQLDALGLETGRLKTGTTPRLDGRTIDWSVCTPQPGDSEPRRLSFYWEPPMLPQVSCHVTYTNERTHELILNNLDRSPMFSGQIEGIGARYCPSIEDKVHRFADKSAHHIFLEPQGLNTHEVYPNGISTSLPFDVQLELVHSIPGLEKAEIIRPGYAVEYDFVNPIQLSPTLELRALPGLWLAGQINGTSGYEEAAAQGLIAGVNAAHTLLGRDPLILGRDESYIGVLIDDLTTLGATEPYRMFTSRAEFRLLLREDNADRRLSPIGHRIGLLSEPAWARFEERLATFERVLPILEETTVGPNEANREHVAAVGLGSLDKSVQLSALLSRPNAELELLAPLAPEAGLDTLEPRVAEALTVEVRYAGYIDRQREEALRLREQESRVLPPSLDYEVVPGLSHEVREKLLKVRPHSLGQAGRIPGVTPAALTNLWMYLKRQEAGELGQRSGEPA